MSRSVSTLLRSVAAAAALGVPAASCGGSDEPAEDPPPACWALGPALPETSPAPPARGEAAAAYDPRCERVLVFFGDAGVPIECRPTAQDTLDDAYAFDLRTRRWHALLDVGAASPTPRARAAAVWDPNAERVLLFGGRTPDGAGGYTFWNDVWAYDPETAAWEELAARRSDDLSGRDWPVGRSNPGLAFDAAQNRLLVHGGGRLQGGLTFVATGDTWAFDPATATFTAIGLAGDEPPKRLSHAVVFDPSARRLYAFGGIPDRLFTATWAPWVLDLGTDTWSPLEGEAVGDVRLLERFKHGGVLDPTDPNRILVVGGHDNLELGNNNDVWTFDLGAGRWARVREGDTFNRPGDPLGCDFPGDFALADLASPERRSAHVAVAAGEHGVFVFGGSTDCGKTRDTWLLDPATMTWEEVVPSTNAVGLTCFRRGLPEGTCTREDSQMCVDT